MGYFCSCFWRFPSTRDFAGQFPEPVRVSLSPISPRSSVLRKAWEWVVMMRMWVFWLPKAWSLAPVDLFGGIGGKSLGEHISADKLRHEDVSTSPFRNLLGREFWLKFSRLGDFLNILSAAKSQTWREGYPCLSWNDLFWFAGSLE